MTAISLANQQIETIQKLPRGWATAVVTFLAKGKEQKRLQIIDTRTLPHMQYRHDPLHVISFKCFALTVGTPLYLAGNLIFHLVRTIALVARTLFRSLCKVISKRSWDSLKKCAHDWTFKASASFLQGIRDLVRAPFYAFQVTLAAAYGIFHPLEGRIFVANAERKWRGSNRTHDLRRFNKQQGAFFKDLFTNRHSKNTCFMAYCFQPIGPLDAPHIKRVEILDPKKIQTVVMPAHSEDLQ